MDLINEICKPQKDEIIVIAGPTASGKTALSIKAALKFNGEVISADSRQVYRGLDIGSAKITKSEMRGINHHLIDIKEPGEKYSVAQFQYDTLNLVKDIQSRGKVPIICGGTGLYIESIVEGYDFGQDGKSKLKFGYNPKFRVYLLQWPREILRQRISTRVDQRMKFGMLEEVQNLIKNGVDPKWLISLGLEYRYLTEYLLANNFSNSISPSLEARLSPSLIGRGATVAASAFEKKKIDLGKFRDDAKLEEAVAILKFKIYQFAKRQDTWFKRWSYAIKINLNK